MNRFLRGGLAAVLAVVAGVGQLGCVAEVGDETSDLQGDSAEQVGEAKGALGCSVAEYKVGWQPEAGVYSIADQNPKYLIKKKRYDQYVSGPYSRMSFPSRYNEHRWTLVAVNGGIGFMRRGSLNYTGCY